MFKVNRQAASTGNAMLTLDGIRPSTGESRQLAPSPGGAMLTLDGIRPAGPDRVCGVCARAERKYCCPRCGTP